MQQRSYAAMDEALAVLSEYGPELNSGLTNHAPMATEALCAMGRPEAVMPWLERYRQGMLPRSASRGRIITSNWRSALARPERTADWSEFFYEELRQVPWREVLHRWVSRLAPGLCGAATHGVIRVGHAARSLEVGESSVRLQELADGLAYFAATYQELPGAADLSDAGLKPSEAIQQVAVIPANLRRFSGTITSSLAALDEFPEFAPVIGLIGVDGDAAKILSNLTQTFARVYLANAHDILTTIAFIHGVTSAVALRNLLPYLDDTTARLALRYGWQAGCGLYAAFGAYPAPVAIAEPPRETREELIARAVANGDEHVIKFTEACLREYALNPAPEYLAAARHAFDVL